jgi:serine-type D-Ala-D-Ala carboxypeptidase (penicillin-binding protein 5/6)
MLLRFLTFLHVLMFLQILTFPVCAKLMPAVDIEGRQFLVIDGDTETILFEHEADLRMYPSSMTKILTAYIIFEEIASGKISFNTMFAISRKASKTDGTKMYLPEGKTVSVEDLIQGIFVASGNDACVCAAENISGSEEAFAARMNQKLTEFGCKDSHFMNASGLPNENHYSTCRDLYKIAKRLYADFSQYKHFFSQQEFTYGKGTHKNLNRLYKTFEGADGLKTGHTQGGGYGVITSALVNGQRIFSIVNGCKTMVERNRVSESLMRWAYSTFHQVTALQKDQIIAKLDTWMADHPQVPVGLKNDVILTLPKGSVQGLTSELVFQGPIEPPVACGDKIGELVLTMPDQQTKMIYPVYAQTTIAKAGFLRRLPIIIQYLLFGKNAQ